MSLIQKIIMHPIVIILGNVIGKFAHYAYKHPFCSAILLSALGQIYLIYDISVVNSDMLSLLWHIENGQDIPRNYNGILVNGIVMIKTLFGLSATLSAYIVMISVYTAITVVMLLITKELGFSLVAQWMMIFLLLCHPIFNDYRSIIGVEAFYWLFLITAIWSLLKYYKSNIVLAITLWFALFFMATLVSFTAWVWLILFPLGAFFLKDWRKKPVMYALGAYAFLVLVCLFIPINDKQAIDGVSSIFNAKSENFKQLLLINNEQIINQDDWLMSAIFVLTGAASLVLIRLAISLSIINVVLLVYAFIRKQYVILDKDLMRILLYAVVFDIAVAIWYFMSGQTQEDPVFFSTVLLLLFFAVLGLSRVVKRMYLMQYSHLKILLIIWCMVAYFASGYIIFGPKKDYYNQASQYIAKNYNLDRVSSDSSLLLFLMNKNPNSTLSLDRARYLSASGDFYYVFSKHRRKLIPKFLADKKVITQFSNRRGDSLLLYHLRPSQ